jgi:hypothetical protein
MAQHRPELEEPVPCEANRDLVYCFAAAGSPAIAQAILTRARGDVGDSTAFGLENVNTLIGRRPSKNPAG